MISIIYPAVLLGKDPFKNNNTIENIDMKYQLLEPVSVAAGTCRHGTVGFVTFLIACDLFVHDCSGFISV